MYNFICNMIAKMVEVLSLTKKENHIDFLCGGEALPKQLAKEEVDKNLLAMAAGDMTARKLLIEHNLRLVVYIAKKFDNTPIDIEDLISVGTVGLIKAINSYDLSKNIKLATYASRCIENEILMCLRKTNKQKSEISLEEPLNVDWEGNMLLLSDILGTEEDAIFKEVELRVEIDVLLESFKKLTNREKLILKLRYGLFGVEEKTQKEIADMMGISQSYISRLEKKVLSRLKKEMSKLI